MEVVFAVANLDNPQAPVLVKGNYIDLTEPVSPVSSDYLKSLLFKPVSHKLLSDMADVSWRSVCHPLYPS